MSSSRPLRIGTRGSALALWQARHVEQAIRALPDAPEIELVRIRTEGDVRTDVPLWQVAGRAFFTKEIDRALLAGEVDIAVHSLKDLSTVLESGIELAAALRREDPRDALVSHSGAPLAQLPQGARIGTSSLRRRAFLARARPDVRLLELRGNVPTRIERLRDGDYDAIVLAAAGLSRLGLDGRITERLASEFFPPAVSQGVIGVCTREADAVASRWARQLDDRASRLAVTAERALLRTIEAGCQVPLGALACVVRGADSKDPEEELHLHAVVCSLDGARSLSSAGEVSATLSNAASLGQELGRELLARGASELIAREREARQMVEEP